MACVPHCKELTGLLLIGQCCAVSPEEKAVAKEYRRASMDGTLPMLPSPVHLSPDSRSRGGVSALPKVKQPTLVLRGARLQSSAAFRGPRRSPADRTSPTRTRHRRKPRAQQPPPDADTIQRVPMTRVQAKHAESDSYLAGRSVAEADRQHFARLNQLIENVERMANAPPKVEEFIPGREHTGLTVGTGAELAPHRRGRRARGRVGRRNDAPRYANVPAARASQPPALPFSPIRHARRVAHAAADYSPNQQREREAASGSMQDGSGGGGLGVGAGVGRFATGATCSGGNRSAATTASPTRLTPSRLRKAAGESLRRSAMHASIPKLHELGRFAR